MRSEFRNIFADDAGHAALEWNTSGDANGNDVSYDGVSLLEVEDGKVSRFRAYFDLRTVNEQVVD
jgi:ketosteroid isomerase-like protein